MKHNPLAITIREALEGDSEYQQFFRKVLEKAGKSIPAMSDDEKREFFNKVDAAWNGKTEKVEVNEAIVPTIGSHIKVFDAQEGIVNATVVRVTDSDTIVVKTKDGKFVAEKTKKGTWEIGEDAAPLKEAIGDDLYSALQKVKAFQGLGADQQGELIGKIEKLFKQIGIR